MSKRIYISADYSKADGDRNVVNELHRWGSDNKHKVDYCDTAEVVSGSVANDSDCRSCDLKEEFNRQINVSSAVIFIVGDKTSSRTAGSSCKRISEDFSFSRAVSSLYFTRSSNQNPLFSDILIVWKNILILFKFICWDYCRGNHYIVLKSQLRREIPNETHFILKR